MDQQPNYDFIMNSSKPKGAGLTMASKKQRILVVIGGAIGLLVATLIIGGLLGSSANKSNNQLLDLVAYQSELKRVIALGTTRARSADTLNKAITASYTLDSDYQRSVSMVKARGIAAPKDLTARYAGKSSDTALDDAEKANAFDQKYEELYKEKLTNYKAKLSEVYQSLNPGEQVIVKSQSDNAKILLGESTTVPNK